MALFDSGVPYTRLINASGNMQRYRLMRYVMVLGIILVTIFLYVSYYTTPMVTVDNRYSAYVSHEQPPPVRGYPPYVPSQEINNNSDQNFYSIVTLEGNSSGAVVTKEQQQPSQQQQSETSLVVEEGSPPSEATKQQSSSSSNNNRPAEGGNISNKKDEVVVVPTKDQQEKRRLDFTSNLTASEY